MGRALCPAALLCAMVFNIRKRKSEIFSEGHGFSRAGTRLRSIRL